MLIIPKFIISGSLEIIQIIYESRDRRKLDINFDVHIGALADSFNFDCEFLKGELSVRDDTMDEFHADSHKLFLQLTPINHKNEGHALGLISTIFLENSKWFLCFSGVSGTSTVPSSLGWHPQNWSRGHCRCRKACWNKQ